MPRRHGTKQVGRKRGKAALARQIVAEKRNGSNTGGFSQTYTYLTPFLRYHSTGEQDDFAPSQPMASWPTGSEPTQRLMQQAHSQIALSNLNT
jgi:hypothetical protein